MRTLLIFFVLPLAAHAQWWSVQTSGVDANLRGVSVQCCEDHDGKYQYIIWASGSNGVVLRSTNDGSSWKQLRVPGGDDLDFRDIEAFGSDVAYVMSSGNGDKSRIYKTTDGGKSWKLQYSDQRAAVFLDSLACESSTHCYALGDPVDGKFMVLATADGEHWRELSRDRMPVALTNEGAFAASGSAIALCGDGNIFFGTGGSAMARIFRSADRGRTWSAQVTPILAGPSSGIFSIACGGRSSRLVAMGGDYKDATRARTVAIHSEDGGQSWALSPQQPGGYRSAVGSFSDGEFAAVGPNGTDISHDAGVHWTHTDPLNLNAVSFKGAAGWGVGPNGMIARFKSPVPTSNLVLPAAIGTSGSIHWQTLAAFELVGVWHLLAHPR